MYQLFDYQDTAVGGVRSKYAHGIRKCLLVIPTGGGKTVCFSYMAQVASDRMKKVLILAHRIELLEQCGEKLNENGVKFGYLNPKYRPNKLYRVQVGTCQTVIKRMVKMDFVPDLIIIDEAHRSMSKTYREIIAHYPNALILGVTATPVRGDGKSLKEIYEAMVIGPSVRQLMSMGRLVERVITYAPSDPDLSGIDTVRGDYDNKQLGNRMNTTELTGDAVTHYRKFAHGLPAVAFCVNVQHAKDVAAQFRADGYTCEHIDGTMDGTERKRILNGLRDRTINIVTSVDLITEGFDAPILQCAIVLRPTQSLGLYIQMAGRILRWLKGKDFAIVLDHANCTKKHGLITADQEWSLDDGVKKKKKKGDREPLIKVKQCPKCYLMHEPGPVCPECGYVYVAEAKSPTQVEGELKPITEEDMKVIKEMRKRRIAGAKTLEELQKIGEQYGYHYRWATTVWESKNKRLGLV